MWRNVKWTDILMYENVEKAHTHFSTSTCCRNGRHKEGEKEVAFILTGTKHQYCVQTDSNLKKIN